MAQDGGGGGTGWSSLAGAVARQVENQTQSVVRQVCGLTYMVARHAGNPTHIVVVGQVENLTSVVRPICNPTRVARRLLLVTLLVISTRAAGNPLEDLADAPEPGSTSRQTAPSMALAAPELAGSSTGSESKTLQRGAHGRKNGQRSSMRPRSARRGGPFASRTVSSESQSAPWYRSVLGSLAVVLLVMGAVYWVLKRWLPGSRLSESRVLHVVARTTLTPKHGVALVHLGRRFVMVGTSPDSVTVLSEITDPEEVADLAARTGLGVGRDRSGFDDLLSQEATGYRRPDRAVKAKPRVGKAGASHQRPAAQGLTDLLDRLRTLRST